MGREVHQRQGGQGSGEQRILKEPTAAVNRHKWRSYGFNHFLFYTLPLPSIHSPNLPPIFFPSTQSSTPTIGLYDIFCDNQSLLWGWVCVNVDQYVEVCCTLSTPLSSVLIVRTPILATITPHCDSSRVHDPPWAVSLWSLSISS